MNCEEKVKFSNCRRGERRKTNNFWLTWLVLLQNIILFLTYHFLEIDKIIFSHFKLIEASYLVSSIQQDITAYKIKAKTCMETIN
jgi:hypothetical protein